MRRQVKIPQTEQIPVLHEHLTLFIFQIITVSAKLCTLAAVCTSPGHNLADVTLATVGNTERAMDKTLQDNACLAANCTYLLKTEFPCQHHLPNADIFPEAHLFN